MTQPIACLKLGLASTRTGVVASAAGRGPLVSEGEDALQYDGVRIYRYRKPTGIIKSVKMDDHPISLLRILRVVSLYSFVNLYTAVYRRR